MSGAIWDTLPVTEKEKDEICFQNLPSSVKINQFPGLFSIGRKDSLWRGYRKMRDVWGTAEFDFHSRTFILPEDRKEVEEAMEKENKACEGPPSFSTALFLFVSAAPLFVISELFLT